MTVGSRRSGLNQNMALKEQYERALQDLADLVDTAKDKMAADQRIVASSVEEIQNHLDKHKVMIASVLGQFVINRRLTGVFLCVLQEFFQGLESHMILTETYFRKISGLMLPKESQALEETLAETQSVLKEAHSKGVELEGILEVRHKTIQDCCCTIF